MASVRDIRRHIRSVSNIKKITKTMEMVAAARMHKATAALLASRPYAQLAWHMLLGLSSKAERELHPLLRSRSVEKTMIVLITSDRGLCGSFNLHLIRQALKLVTDKDRFQFIAIGRKGREFLTRQGYQVIAEFTGLAAPVPYLAMGPIAQIVFKEYMESKVDEVYIVYSNFISNFVQKPSYLKLAPLINEQAEPDVRAPFVYEPSAEAIMATLIPRIIEYQIYAMMLETQASEFAARMVAMKNATENAEKLIDDLVLSCNKVRQESITKELTELSTSTAVIEEV